MTLFVAGNWKMFASRAGVTQFVESLASQWQAAPGVVPVVFPPVGYLAQLQAELASKLPGSVALGGQRIHPEPEGAFTGESSASMMLDLGASWVLAGHSERRNLFGESDEMVASQVQAALTAGLKPVLCVGETLAQRQAGEAQAVVGRQLDAVFANLPAGQGFGQSFGQGAVAYEPVWAIGTGETASPAQAQDMHGFVRERLTAMDAKLAEVPLWYGGSVKPENAAELFAAADIDGALIGGASLAATSFWQIIEQAAGLASAEI